MLDLVIALHGAPAVARRHAQADDLTITYRDALDAALRGDYHGEPHPGNTRRTDRGWVLIDWDTALLAPPERDLSVVARHPDEDDGICAAYTSATEARARGKVMELYRLRWELADLAIAAAQFSPPHPGNANDQESFALLAAQLERLAEPPGPLPGPLAPDTPATAIRA